MRMWGRLLGESRRSIQPRRRLSLTAKLESKGAAVKRPLTGTICSVIKFSPGTCSSTGLPADWELRDTTGVWVPELITRANVTVCRWMGAGAIRWAHMTLLLTIIVVWLLLNAVYFWWVSEGRYRRRPDGAAVRRNQRDRLWRGAGSPKPGQDRERRSPT